MTFLALDGITKRYGQQHAVDRLSFAVEKGECLALLGPSGCGKTTTLNMIAGFIRPDAGDIRLAGRSIIDLPPNRRGMGMVFQDYALFPHLSVIENIEFGLRMRRVDAAQRRRTAQGALELVGLAGLGERGVGQLSGGQRQRVAVARALAIAPDVLLFDEPLSNLDARLRDTMRTEIRSLITRTGITAVFVTHDQAEAFAVADRVALLNAGRLEQIGALDAIYERPASAFVAAFLGSCNLITGRAESSAGGTVVVETGGVRFVGRCPESASGTVGAEVTLALRPHHIVVAPKPDEGCENRIAATVTAVEYLGWLTKVGVRHASGLVLALEIQGKAALAVGDAVDLGWRAADAWAIPRSAA